MLLTGLARCDGAKSSDAAVSKDGPELPTINCSPMSNDDIVFYKLRIDTGCSFLTVSF